MGNLTRREDPEEKIRGELITFLKKRGWLMQLFHNDQYQRGIPDLYAHHPSFSYRWIDAKNPKRYSFTKAQLDLWPIWEKFKCGIWIMVAATEDEYKKLWQPPNWRSYLRPFEQRKLDIDLKQLMRDCDEDS